MSPVAGLGRAGLGGEVSPEAVLDRAGQGRAGRGGVGVRDPATHPSSSLGIDILASHVDISFMWALVCGVMIRHG